MVSSVFYKKMCVSFNGIYKNLYKYENLNQNSDLSLLSHLARI